MKKGNKGFITFVLLMVVVVLILYVYLSNHATGDKETTQSSETETLLNVDLDQDYPKTVRETVKYHCSYLKNAYNGKFTDDELIQVNQQIRKLMDDELLEANEEATQLQGLRDQVELYQEEKRKIVSFTLAEGSQVEYNKEGGKEYAKLKVTFKFSSSSVEEEYILRKDDEGRWKILGWQVANQTGTTTEGETE
jgi:hypothetical protein